MLKTPSPLRLLFLTALILLVAGGCGSDDPVNPPAKGTIVISSTPAEANGHWTLSASSVVFSEGTADTTLAEMMTDAYEIVWDDTEGWLTPASETKVLAPGESITFMGTYVKEPLPFAGSEVQLMENFRTVYESMDADLLATMLHPDHLFYLQPSTQEEYPDIGPVFDLAAELRIAERMFGGAPVIDPNGNLVAGVGVITFMLFVQQTAWVDTQANDVIANARTAIYDVIFLLDRPGHSTLKPTGQMKFYAVSRDSLHEGVVQPYFELIGQQDFTASKNVENAVWGSVKAMFR